MFKKKSVLLEAVSTVNSPWLDETRIFAQHPSPHHKTWEKGDWMETMHSSGTIVWPPWWKWSAQRKVQCWHFVVLCLSGVSCFSVYTEQLTSAWLPADRGRKEGNAQRPLRSFVCRLLTCSSVTFTILCHHFITIIFMKIVLVLGNRKC